MQTPRMTLEAFSRLRPRLFHLTARQNLVGMRADGCLRSAASIYTNAGLAHQTHERRATSEVVTVGGRGFHIRDQAPLHERNTQLAEGMVFEDFIAHLNAHVYFWPGDATKPIEYGTRHFRRYCGDDCVVLSVDTSALFAANAPAAPLFCRYNSGSPRWSAGRPSPRGPNTFVGSEAFDGTAGTVVEVVYRDRRVC